MFREKAPRKLTGKKLSSALVAFCFLLAAAAYVITDQSEDDSDRSPVTTAESADPAPEDSESESAATPAGQETVSDEAESILDNDLAMNGSQARTTLDVLPIKKAEPMTGYSEDFFPFWRSANAWGWEDIPEASDCDAREATLARDGDGVKSNPETCHAEEGVWYDPYTGDKITASREVDIDHIVPRAAAYRAGANTWDKEQRTIFANSPLVLVSSGASSNREKGDKGPEAWKPENRDAWCSYSRRWIAVKNEFGLNLISKKEKAALEEMLDTCDEEAA